MLTPKYHVQEQSGPTHLPVFEVNVMPGETSLATARAGNRKTAEKEAARKAIEKLQEHADDPEQ